MAHAPGCIISECIKTIGRANPVTTIIDVMNRPRSTGPDPSYDAENSSPPQCENTAFGKGARTNVKALIMSKSVRIGFVTCMLLNAPTSNGSQFTQSAQDNMIKRNPTASTKERRMTAECQLLAENRYSQDIPTFQSCCHWSLSRRCCDTMMTCLFWVRHLVLPKKYNNKVK